MALYEPIRDAFREWNRLLIDRQEWDAKHQLAREDMKLRGQLMDSQLADAQLNREWNQAKYDEWQADREPVSFSLYNFMQGNEDLVTKQNLPELREMFELPKNTPFSEASGSFTDADGEPLKMSRRSVKEGLPFLQAWVNLKADNVGKMAGERIKAISELEEIEKTLSTLQNDGRKDMNAIQKATRMKSQIQADITKIDQFFSPEGQMQYWTAQGNAAARAAAASKARGMDGMAAIYQNQANQAWETQRKALAQMSSTTTGTWTPRQAYKDGKPWKVIKSHSTTGIFLINGKKHIDLPEGVTLVSGAGGYTTAADPTDYGRSLIRKTITPQKDFLPVLGDRNAFSAYAEGIYDKLVRDVGAPATEGKAAEYMQAAIQEGKKDHADYLEVLTIIERQTLLPKTDKRYLTRAEASKKYEQLRQIVLNEMGYEPARPFTQQIGKQKAKKANPYGG
jgi:hypothetical protein